MRARLTVVTGDSTPTVYELVPDRAVTLGRGRNNSILVHDETVSRHHAEIVYCDGRWLLHNISDPSNGTSLNGARISGPTELLNGHEIGIGAVRLCFTREPTEDNVSAERKISDLGGTHFSYPDDLTLLWRFVNAAVEETEPRPLLHQALAMLVQKSRAAFAGFLSLDPESPLPRVIVPEQAILDGQLSRQMTQLVQQQGRSVWLAAIGDKPQTDSLKSFSDALCLPLRSGETVLGALHLYKSQGLFHERDLRFGEVMASCLTRWLLEIRTRRSLEAENARLRSHTPSGEELIGDSKAMHELRQTIARVAPRPVTVLIRGESGVGKELVALALHRQSARGGCPLVAINCAAISGTLPEAELFGHRKGAFTGADRDRPGLFEQADEGTLFLDEIGDLSVDIQAKLLRAIEGKGFRPVGATAERKVDVRIIAATNRDLEQLIHRSEFRRDLLYRLQVIQILVPPLREHPEDIPQLVDHFLERLRQEYHQQVHLTEAAQRRLQTYAWPGNVRQLWAVLESAVTASQGAKLDAPDLPLSAECPAISSTPLNLEELETGAIRAALRQTEGNISRAAQLLGIGRDTLAIKLRKRGIDRPR